MNENLNLVKILKDCPRGTKLYSTVLGEVKLDYVENGGEYPIKVLLKGDTDSFTKDGRLYSDYEGECVLFPSKYERDWRKFKEKKDRFNPKTLKPFDKVLTRDDGGEWFCHFFSHHYNIESKCRYAQTDGCVYDCCIPYNNDTKHLVGTNKEAPEYYRYLEE